MSERRYSRSYSQLNTYTRCGEAYRLSRIVKPRPPQRPAAWLAVGTAAHGVYEDWELRGRDEEWAPALRFEERYAQEIEALKVRQPDLALWQKTPRVKTVENDILLRGEHGLKHVAAYQEHCLKQSTLDNGWSLWETPEGLPAVEVGFVVELGGIEVKGYIDSILEWGDGSITIRDLKGLPVGTRLPTPTGWTTMGEVQVGDYLIGSDGRPCRVTEKSAASWKPCYRVEFDDRTSVVCDNEHLWKVETRDGVGKWTESVMDIESIRETLRLPWGAQPARHRVILTEPLELPPANLPIDPYVLGVWLGDGKHTTGEVCFGDEWIASEIDRRGYSLGSHTSVQEHCFSATVLGIRGRLRSLGVLGDKHIPETYLRASKQQRLDLLRGLMDSDGTWNIKRDSATFTSTNKRLSQQFEELALTLGLRPRMFEYTARGFGVTTTAYPVTFTPATLNPFLLPRKADKVAFLTARVKSNRRLIVNVVPLPSLETQCVAVDSPDSTYLCGDQMVVTHNTGNKQDNLFQHGLYKIAANQLFGLDIQLAETWYLKTGDSGGWVDTSRITKEYLADQFYKLDRAIQDGIFLANPGDHCGMCDVQPWCRLRGYLQEGEPLPGSEPIEGE